LFHFYSESLGICFDLEANNKVVRVAYESGFPGAGFDESLAEPDIQCVV
jgi:hypothetical protein